MLISFKKIISIYFLIKKIFLKNIPRHPTKYTINATNNVGYLGLRHLTPRS
jgi:hypothetical protein